MRLFTFLGTGKYEETLYFLGNQEKITSFAPLASAEFLQVDEMVVFLTEKAWQEQWASLQAQVNNQVPIKYQIIPLGETVEELWYIFDQIASQAQPGEKIAFDITHGLRSTPLVGLLVAAYLHSGLSVDIQALHYGAYDVRDRTTQPNRTPIFDLSDMLKLLDWSLAAERFNRIGDSVALASLLEREKKEIALKLAGDKKLMSEFTALGQLSGKLRDVSQSLNLIRTQLSLQNARSLIDQIPQANQLLEKSPSTKPVALIMQRIEETYHPIAVENQSPVEFIQKQYALINWYMDREQWAQAITTAREWMVNLFMVHLKLTDFSNRDLRERVEKVINSEAYDFRSAKSKKQSFTPIFLAHIPDIETLLDTWNAITEVRNDIDHAGFRQNAKSSLDLIKNIGMIISKLKQIPLPVEPL